MSGDSQRKTYRLLRALLARLSHVCPDLLPALAPVVCRVCPRRHGPGFASVLWDGASYAFSPTQARVVAQLWEAWENGTPDVRQELLLSEAGSESDRLVDLFRDHEAWGKFIVSGEAKGTFRLAD